MEIGGMPMEQEEESVEAAVALLFLTKGGVNNPEIWESWLTEAPRNSYNLHIYATDQAAVRHKLFQTNLISENVDPKPSGLWQLKAELELLREALKNRSNKWFMLLSDGCLPLFSFSYFHGVLQDLGENSVFNVFPDTIQNMQREFAAANVAETLGGACNTKDEQLIQAIIQAKQMTAHSQWCMLSRRDAEILANASDMELWFDAFTQILRLDQGSRGSSLTPEELYPLSYLKYYHWQRNESYVLEDRAISFSHCCMDFEGCECPPGWTGSAFEFRSLQRDLVVLCIEKQAVFARQFLEGIPRKHFEYLWSFEDDPKAMADIAGLSQAILDSRDGKVNKRQLELCTKKLEEYGYRYTMGSSGESNQMQDKEYENDDIKVKTSALRGGVQRGGKVGLLNETQVHAPRRSGLRNNRGDPLAPLRRQPGGEAATAAEHAAKLRHRVGVKSRARSSAGSRRQGCQSETDSNTRKVPHHEKLGVQDNQLGVKIVHEGINLEPGAQLSNGHIISSNIGIKFESDSDSSATPKSHGIEIRSEPSSVKAQTIHACQGSDVKADIDQDEAVPSMVVNDIFSHKQESGMKRKREEEDGIVAVVDTSILGGDVLAEFTSVATEAALNSAHLPEGQPGSEEDTIASTICDEMIWDPEKSKDLDVEVASILFNVGQKLCKPSRYGRSKSTEKLKSDRSTSVQDFRSSARQSTSQVSDEGRLSSSASKRNLPASQVPVSVTILSGGEHKTLSGDALEANITAVYEHDNRRVKKNKRKNIHEYAALFLKNEKEKLCTMWQAEDQKANSVFGWKTVDIHHTDKWKQQAVKRMAERYPYAQDKYKLLYEHFNELGLHPVGCRHSPRGWEYRPGSSQAFKRLYEGFEYNPMKANRELAKRQWGTARVKPVLTAASAQPLSMLVNIANAQMMTHGALSQPGSEAIPDFPLQALPPDLLQSASSHGIPPMVAVQNSPLTVAHASHSPQFAEALSASQHVVPQTQTRFQLTAAAVLQSM